MGLFYAKPGFDCLFHFMIRVHVGFNKGRNPEADSKVEFIMGLNGVGAALPGFYFIWW